MAVSGRTEGSRRRAGWGGRTGVRSDSAPAPPAPGLEPPGELVRRAAEGDRAAWDRLVQRHTPTLWRVARWHRLSAADAADAVQLAWLRLAERLPDIPDPDGVVGWLAVTVRRECLRILARPAPEPPAGSGWAVWAAAAAGRAPTAGMIQAPAAAVDDERDLLRAAFDRLPTRQRQLLHALLVWPPPSYQQVATSLGIRVGSIGPTRQRALARLRREFDALRAAPARADSARPDTGPARPDAGPARPAPPTTAAAAGSVR